MWDGRPSVVEVLLFPSICVIILPGPVMYWAFVLFNLLDVYALFCVSTKDHFSGCFLWAFYCFQENLYRWHIPLVSLLSLPPRLSSHKLFLFFTSISIILLEHSSIHSPHAITQSKSSLKVSGNWPFGAIFSCVHVYLKECSINLMMHFYKEFFFLQHKK